MKEMRLCWRDDIVHGKDDQVQNGGNWMEATFENRREMKIILEAALKVYGPGSHWLEQRDTATVTAAEMSAILQPFITTIVVHDAVLKALIASHPDRAEAKRVAELVLMQAQSKSALSAASTGLLRDLLGDNVRAALESLFQPPTVLPPNDEGEDA